MTDTYSRRTLTALFDNEDKARDAVAKLRAVGLPDTSIRLVAGDSTGSSTQNEDKTVAKQYPGS